MTATIHSIPDRERGLGLARLTLRSANATRAELLTACDVLERYGEWPDEVLAHQMRAAIRRHDLAVADRAVSRAAMNADRAIFWFGAATVAFTFGWIIATGLAALVEWL